MDIFNKKKVAELEKELDKTRKLLRKVEADRNGYHNEVNMLREMVKFEETIPKDCVKGSWCGACEFVKEFYRVDYDYFGHSYTVHEYSCGKGESCKNFIQKETVKE